MLAGINVDIRETWSAAAAAAASSPAFFCSSSSLLLLLLLLLPRLLLRLLRLRERMNEGKARRVSEISKAGKCGLYMFIF